MIQQKVKMRLSANNIMEIIKKEISELTENTLGELDDLDTLSKLLTVMNDETREKLTIQGKGDGMVTLQTAEGESLSVTEKDFQKDFILPKDASDSDDEQINGDKEDVKEAYPQLESLVKEAMWASHDDAEFYTDRHGRDHMVRPHSNLENNQSEIDLAKNVSALVATNPQKGGIAWAIRQVAIDSGVSVEEVATDVREKGLNLDQWGL